MVGLQTWLNGLNALVTSDGYTSLISNVIGDMTSPLSSILNSAILKKEKTFDPIPVAEIGPKITGNWIQAGVSEAALRILQRNGTCAYANYTLNGDIIDAAYTTQTPIGPFEVNCEISFPTQFGTALRQTCLPPDTTAWETDTWSTQMMYMDTTHWRKNLANVVDYLIDTSIMPSLLTRDLIQDSVTALTQAKGELFDLTNAIVVGIGPEVGGEVQWLVITDPLNLFNFVLVRSPEVLESDRSEISVVLRRNKMENGFLKLNTFLMEDVTSCTYPF